MEFFQEIEEINLNRSSNKKPISTALAVSSILPLTYFHDDILRNSPPEERSDKESRPTTIKEVQKQILLSTPFRRRNFDSQSNGSWNRENEDELETIINIPDCLLTISNSKGFLSHEASKEGYRQINQLEQDAFKSKLLNQIIYRSSVAKFGDISHQQYLAQLQDFYKTHKQDLDQFIIETMGHLSHTKESNNKSDSVFLIHAGRKETVISYIGDPIEKLTESEIFDFTDKCPAFMLFSERDTWRNGKETTCSVVTTNLVPQDGTKENHKERLASSLEGCIYSQLILQPDIIGLGGMLPAACEKGVSAQISMDLIKLSILNAQDISEEDIRSNINIFNTSITTGHTGTTLSILETLSAYETLHESVQSNSVIVGGGGIGVSVAVGLLERKHKEIPQQLMTIYLVDRNIAIARSAVNKVMEGLKKATGTSAFPNFSVLPILASELLKIAYDNPDEFKKIHQMIFCTSATEPLLKNDTWNNICKNLNGVIFADDQHPPAIEYMTDFPLEIQQQILEKESTYSEIGVILPIRRRVVFVPKYGNYFMLDKPQPSFDDKGNEIIIDYGCAAEAKVLTLTGLPGLIADTTPDKVTNLIEIFHVLPGVDFTQLVKFHAKGIIEGL